MEDIIHSDGGASMGRWEFWRDELSDFEEILAAIFDEENFLLSKDLLLGFCRNWHLIGDDKNSYKALFSLCKIMDMVITDKPQDKINLAKLTKRNYKEWR